MRSVETQYKDRINFISVDGSNSKNGMFYTLTEILYLFKYSIAVPNNIFPYDS